MVNLSGPNLETVTVGAKSFPDDSVETSIITPCSKNLYVHGKAINKILIKSKDDMKMIFSKVFIKSIVFKN